MRWGQRWWGGGWGLTQCTDGAASADGIPRGRQLEKLEGGRNQMAADRSTAGKNRRGKGLREAAGQRGGQGGVRRGARRRRGAAARGGAGRGAAPLTSSCRPCCRLRRPSCPSQRPCRSASAKRQVQKGMPGWTSVCCSRPGAGMLRSRHALHAGRRRRRPPACPPRRACLLQAQGVVLQLRIGVSKVNKGQLETEKHGGHDVTWQHRSATHGRVCSSGWGPPESPGGSRQ